MPRPVVVLSGERKRPSDWRAPIVIIRTPAAESVMTQRAGWLRVRNMVIWISLSGVWLMRVVLEVRA
jgi:hypothetical protein